MQQFEHIQSIWQSHTVDVKISAEEMLSQAKKEVSSIKTKSVLNIAGMTSTVITIALLWLFLDLQSWTTHVALTIMITTIAIYTFILYRGYRLISKTDFTAHPNEFLIQLKIYQMSRLRLYNRLYWFYVLALTFSMILYFFEISDNLEIWIQILFIAFTVLWLVFCSTWFRKTVLLREKEKISELTKRFTRISGQFQEGT